MANVIRLSAGITTILVTCANLLLGAHDANRAHADEFSWPNEEWETASPADVGMDPRLIESARDYALTGSGSGYITRHGKLILTWGDTRRKYDLKSTSKSIGITALGLAIADGKFALHDRVVDHHPAFGIPPKENAQTGWLNKITVFHLATQTAGFAKRGGYEPLLFEPGTRWHYSDGGPNWLAECVTLAYGRDISDLMFERIFTPIGVTADDLHWRNNSYRPHKISGVMRREFGSGVHANVDAMARLGYLYLRDGLWKGRQLLPSDFIDKARSTFPEVIGLPEEPVRNAATRQGRSSSHGNASDHYGLLWWNNADGSLAGVPHDAYWSWGLHDSLIIVIPSLDIVVSRAGKSWSREPGGEHYDVLKPFLQPIVAAVQGRKEIADGEISIDRPAEQRTYRGLREFNPPPSPNEESVQAIVGATMIDGYGGEPIDDAAIVIKGNRIVAAGSRNDVSIPADATIFDTTGLTILPGLLDAHFHIGSGAGMYEIPPLFLSHGVTTARDPGRPIEIYEPVRDSKKPVPRCLVTGPHFDRAPPAHPHNAVILNTRAEVRRAVQRYFEQGASGIKVYYRLPLELIAETCTTSHALGIPVTAHLELIDADDAILAGLDGIEHIASFGTALAEPDIAARFQEAVDSHNESRKDERYRLWASLDLERSPRVQPLLELIVKHGVYVSPTLATFERRAGDNRVEEFHVRGFENMLKFTGMCHAAGATVVTGSHTWSNQVDLGWAYQREMELLVESGMTPSEVITASTMANARFFGVAERLGSIENGKLADFVLVQGNPLEDIRAMYNVRHVMLNGLWVDQTPPKTFQGR